MTFTEHDKPLNKNYRTRQLAFWGFLLLSVPAGTLGAISGYRILGEGRDYLGYVDFYNDIRMFSEHGFFRFEPGFVLVASFFKLSLNAGVEVFLAALATLSLLIKFTFFSSHPRPFVTIIFYLCCWYPLHEYTQIRVAVSVAFMLLATQYFFRGKLVPFAVFSGLAFLFQASALLIAAAIPAAYIFSAYRLPVVIAGVGVMAAALGVLTGPMLTIAASLNPLTEAYIQNIDGSSVNLFSGVNILTVALLASILLAGSLQNRRDKTYFILVIMALAFAVAFQAMPVFSHRLRELLMIFLVPLAFNMRLTPRGLAQFALSAVLAAVYLYSYVSQGIIGTIS